MLEEVIEADNSEVRPLTLSGLTRTCDSIQAAQLSVPLTEESR